MSDIVSSEVNEFTENLLPAPSLLDSATPAFLSLDGTLAEPAPTVLPAHPQAETFRPPASSTSFLRRLLRQAGVDRAVAFTVLARGWSSLAGLGTLTLIARFLTPAEQGFYYNFYALVAIQIIFELGFSVVILQTASHEAAHLHIGADGTVTGPPREHARLASVLQKAMRWYTIAAVLMAGTLVPVGLLFFRHVAGRQPFAHVHFALPWLLVVVASSCTFQIDPVFSFLEGCGYVQQVARTRFRQSMVSTVLGWSAFLLHHGLFAPGCFILGQALAGGYFIFTRRRFLLPLLHHATNGFRIHWGTEVWPFQWRIAVSWISGYLTSQLFVPTIMNARGPVEAGQLGMSLNVCATLTTMAVSWLNTKASPFGQMISRKEYGRLDRIFARTLAQSTGAAALVCLLVWVAVEWLSLRQVRFHGVVLASRLLPPVPLAMLLLGTVLNVVIIGEALYLRAHKQEKFMVNSIAGALYFIPVALLIGRLATPHGGSWGIAAAYAIGSVAGLGWATQVFLKWRGIWHADGPRSSPA